MTPRAAAAAAVGVLLFGCVHAAMLPAPPPEPVVQEAQGEVQDVDPFAHRVTLRTSAGDLDMVASPDAELLGDTGVGWMQLRELRPGEVVRVCYHVRRDGGREITKLQLLPVRGEPPPPEELPDPRDDEAPIETPVGGLSHFPVGGR